MPPPGCPRGPGPTPSAALTSPHLPSRKDVNMAELAVVTGDQAFYRSEDIQLGEGLLHTHQDLE